MFSPPLFFKTGHRGCRGLYPENTLEGFLHAIQLGVNAIELDVVVSNDQKLIVSHEPYMNPEICLTPDGSTIPEADHLRYNLFNMNYEQIKKFDCGLKVHPRFPLQKKIPAYKPTLEETIDTVEDYLKANNLPSIIYDIEIKSEIQEYSIAQPMPEIFAEQLAAFAIQKNIADKVIFRSFDPAPLQFLHKKYPSFKLALIVENHLSAEMNLQKLGFLPYMYSPEFILVTREEMKYLKSNQLIVVPWTVNEIKDIQTMIALQVDGIITDFPDLFKTMSI